MTKRIWLFSLVCVSLLLTSVPASAEVVNAGATGFSLKVTAEVNAPRAKVFAALTERVGSWWSSSHTYSGSAANMRIEPQAGGCFCETLPNGGVRHMTVTHVMAPDMLVLNGGLGPLGTMGVAGALQWTLKEQDGRTTLVVSYNVGGYAPAGFTALAPLVDGVLAEQVTRLKTFVETGRPQ